MRLPGMDELLARSIENDTGVEINLEQRLIALAGQTHTVVLRLEQRMADGTVTMREARQTLGEVGSLVVALQAALESAKISLRFNRLHNQVMGAMRCGLDPRSREAQERFPLLRLLDPEEGTIVQFPVVEREPEEVVA